MEQNRHFPLKTQKIYKILKEIIKKNLKAPVLIREVFH